jgi:hypothetical protein
MTSRPPPATRREEFKGNRLKGSAIELSNEASTGATQIAAQDFFRITYPTLDLLKAIEAAGPQQGRPIVVIDERGLGKSHLLGALHHGASDSASAESWLKAWATTLRKPEIGQIALRKGALVIGESLHRQRYKFLGICCSRSIRMVPISAASGREWVSKRPMYHRTS